MTLRQKKIYHLLKENESLTAEQIAGLLHISDRTVRNDIREINRGSAQAVILARKGQGYYLAKAREGQDGQAPEEGVNEEDLEWTILRRVLFEGEIPYPDLAEELYISDTFLSRIVKRINRTMAGRYGRAKMGRQNGLLVLDLKEEEKREYYEIYVTYRALGHYFELDSFKPYFEYADLEAIRAMILEETARAGCRFYDMTVMRLVVSTAILFERIYCGHTLEGETREAMGERGEAERRTPPASSGNRTAPPFDETDGHRDCARRIVERIGEQAGKTLPEAEYAGYAELLRNDFYYMDAKHIEETEELLRKLLIEVSVEYGYDFSGSQRFFREMAAQLNGTLLRVRNRQYVMNPFLPQIKAQYPLEYDIAIFFADRFRKFTGVTASEDEIGQFAVHFIGAMEADLGKEQQNAVLINPYGKQIKELIERRLEEMGECRLKIAYSYSIFDYPGQMPKDAAVVLTTVPLPAPIAEVPVILCRNFLDYGEKKKLLTVLKDSQVNGVKKFFKSIFKPSLFFTDMEFETKEETLAFLCGELCRQGYVKEGFFESVMQRENVAPTAFEPGFAFAHSMENNAARTAAAICVLKNRLPWGDCQVRIVFLFALAPTWNHTIIPVYNVMIDNLLQANTIHKLAKIRDYGRFLENFL